MANPIQHILKKKPAYRVAGSLWMEFQKERFFGPGRVELLERIAKSGSISKAAKEMKMSYKKAWEMVTILNRQAARPLVLVQTGGKKGGGSVITPEAKELIKYHSLLRKRFIAFLEKESGRLNSK
jgi:molybdate transport system regulatory protein